MAAKLQTKPYYFDSVQVKIDASSFFTVVQDVLNHAIFAAEKHFLGKQEQIGRTAINRVANFRCPLRVLKRIACKVGCNASTDEEILKSVINLLSNNSWAERAVLTSAAFAMVYGELLFYVDSREHAGFASSISNLMQVDVLIGHRQDPNFQQAIVDLNKLTNIVMEMIVHILEFEKLTNKEYDRKDSSAVRLVEETRNIVSKHSEKVIHSLIDCILQVNKCLDDDGAPKLGLSGWITFQQEQLKELVEWHGKIDELKAYWEIVYAIQNPKGITELITRLMYSSYAGQYFYDCHSKQPVNLDVLKGKSVLLFISSLDISAYDFSALLAVHKGLENYEGYKIVWIPIVEKWDIASTQKFASMIEKMEWYAVCYQKPISGIGYIKREWHFCNNPMVVVFDSDGRRVHDDAMHMIRLWQIEGFPFDPRTEANLIAIPGCLSLFFSYYLQLNQEVTKDTCIIFYGGKDKWIETFRPQVEELAEVVSNQFSVASFAIQNIHGQGDSNTGTEQFWNTIESYYYAMVQWGYLDAATEEIQKLFSYKKYQDGWALVYRMGSSPSMFSVSGVVIVPAVEEFLAQGPSAQIGFGDQLFNCIGAIKPPPFPCCHIEIQSSSGWLPVEVECPFCHSRLKRVVTYVCCHNNQIKENGSP